MLRTFLLAVALALAVPTAAGAALDPFRLSFEAPTQVSQGAAYQAAEPSIRVDAARLTQRTWIAAPTGIGVNTRSLPASKRATSSGTRTTTATAGTSSPAPKASAARRSSAAATATSRR